MVGGYTLVPSTDPTESLEPSHSTQSHPRPHSHSPSPSRRQSILSFHSLTRSLSRSRRALSPGAFSSSLGARATVELDEEQDAHMGVKTVEAAQKVYGPYSIWSLYIGLALASYMYSLDGSTTSYYLTFATSEFSEHALISSVQVAQGIIVAVGKPVIAKVADVTSRATAYITVLVFYVVGYIIIASAQSVGSIAAGIIIYAVGYTGLQLLTQIIIADITSLKWRGLISSLTSSPFIVNAFVGANVAGAVLEKWGWRWGYGMFAILVPISLAPLITTLTWAEHRAKVLGKIPPPPPSSEPLGLGLGSSRIRGSVSRSRGRESLRAPSPNRGSRSRSRSRSTLHSLKSPLHHQTKFHSLLHKIWITAEKLDIVGLVLLGAGIACVLLPLTLSNNSNSRRGWGWGNPSLIGMLIAGIITLIVFAIYELRVAKRPVVAPRFWGNWAVLGAGVIGFFDFMSFYLSYTYLYSFIIVTKDWSLVDDIYFSNVQTVALTVFGILGGLLMRTTHRYKPILIAGLCIRTLGVGVMIHSRGAGGSTPELILTQILQGLGGGFAAVTSQVGAQASVMHGDVAMCTALVLLMTEIGGSVGSAVSGAIWSNTMPHQLSIHLPFLNDTERAKIFGSITDAAARPLSDPVRMGTIAAYSETMKIMLITATLTSIVPIVVSCWMPNWYLGDGQNAVDLRDVRGERVDTAEGEVELDGEEEDDEGGREGERRGDVERGRTR